MYICFSYSIVVIIIKVEMTTCQLFLNFWEQ